MKTPGDYKADVHVGLGVFNGIRFGGRVWLSNHWLLEAGYGAAWYNLFGIGPIKRELALGANYSFSSQNPSQFMLSMICGLESKFVNKEEHMLWFTPSVMFYSTSRHGFLFFCRLGAGLYFDLGSDDRKIIPWPNMDIGFGLAF